MIKAEPAFKIKTGNLPLLQLHINTTDMNELQSQLTQRLAQTPEFFASTPLVLDITSITEFGEVLDFIELVSFMLKQRMCAAGVIGGSEAQRAAAVQAGLGLFSQAPVRNPNRRATDNPEHAHQTPILHEQSELPGFDAPQGADEIEVEEVAQVLRSTMVIDKPVRTGQRIYAEGANLVVLAIVNAGAELIADGDIHVYAPMRGRAIAGAQGNEAARIFVQGMEAELLSIAGYFKVYEEGIPENLRGKPAQVHLEGSRLLIDPLFG